MLNHSFSKKTALFFILSAVLATGCGPSYIFSEKKEISGGVWTYAQPLSFTFQIADTTSRYNLWLDVAARPEFAWENIYTRIYTEFPDGRKKDQLQSFAIFDSHGQVLGDKKGDDYVQQIALQQNAFFDKAGPYTIRMEQYMRTDSVPGIAYFSLHIEKVEKK
jgi:gliding motility-associated lipoprotein GldH